MIEPEILKKHKMLDEYQKGTDRLLSKHLICNLFKSPNTFTLIAVETVCFFDADNLSSVGQINSISAKCIFNSKLSYWKVDGVPVNEI